MTHLLSCRCFFVSAGKWDLVVVSCSYSAACRDISAQIVGDMDIGLFCLFFVTWLHLEELLMAAKP